VTCPVAIDALAVFDYNYHNRLVANTAINLQLRAVNLEAHMTFMADYHQGTLQILEGIKGELDQTGDLTSRAADVIRQGGTVWTSMDSGHMPHAEQVETRRGSPGLLKDHTDFSVLKKGDLVFTHRCERAVLEARERGVYVVCITTNYQDNEFRPAGFTDISHSNPDGLMLKDVANEILHSHAPYQQGLVYAPEIPEFALCASSTTGSGTVHWLINAELANKLADPAAPAVDQSAKYLAILTERIERLTEYMGAIQETAVCMTKRIRDGGRWFARSIEHPGFETEFTVASGPRMVNWGDWEATKEKNVMIISAISPAYAEEIALAQEKKAEGAYVIGIGPDSLDGDVPNVRLLDIADAGFDNFSPESGGVIEIAGQPQTICPTSGIVGNVIQQMIIAQWTQEMIGAGSVPTFLKGFFQSGGREYNDAMESVFEQRGY
jgi:hypothetical protein